MSFVSCGFWGSQQRLYVAVLSDGLQLAHVALKPTRPALARLLDRLAEQQATVVLPDTLPSRALILELTKPRTLHVMFAPDALVSALREVAGFDAASPHLSAALVGRLAHLPLFLDHLHAVPNPRCRYW